MNLKMLFFVGLVALASAKLYDVDDDDSSGSSCENDSVKKWSIMELFDDKSSTKKSLMKLIALIKVAGVIGIPALKLLVEAKMKKAQQKQNEDNYDQMEYVPGYDSYGNMVYWPQKKSVPTNPYAGLFKSKWQ